MFDAVFAEVLQQHLVSWSLAFRRLAVVTKDVGMDVEYVGVAAITKQTEKN